MVSLNVVDSKSQTQVYISLWYYKILECNWFYVVGCWVNFKIGLWENQYFPINTRDPYLSSYSLVTHFIEVYLGFLFICVHKGILVQMQGCIKGYE